MKEFIDLTNLFPVGLMFTKNGLEPYLILPILTILWTSIIVGIYNIKKEEVK